MTSADLDDEELGETDAADDGGDALLEAVVMMTAAFPNSGGLPLALVDALCASSARSFLGGDECLAATAARDGRAGARAGEGRAAVAAAERPAALRGVRRGGARKPAPPVWGAILGGVLGAVPGARDALLGPPGRASVLSGAVQLVSSAAVPVGIINLGGSVASKVGRSERGGDVAVLGGLLGAAVVIRLLVVPCLSCAATVALRLFAPAVVPPGDAALTLVLMLESTPPPAMQCMIFCQLFAQDAERPLGKVLVATYIASLVTLTAWIALFLSLLSAG
ncbi:auxin efflux carrier [Aureococcus anophagefferens]|nr:auxin efflux carrier [Aureococcus anophagefferens]